MGTTAADQRRADKAVFAAQTAGSWIKVRTKDGRPMAYGVPSATNPGVYHLADTQRCSCPDSAQRGAWCWHSRAVALHVARVRAAQQTAVAA